MKIEKIESAITYLVEEGRVTLRANGKVVKVSYYRKEMNDLGYGVEADHDILCDEELTDEEIDEIEDVWRDYKD